MEPTDDQTKLVVYPVYSFSLSSSSSSSSSLSSTLSSTFSSGSFSSAQQQRQLYEPLSPVSSAGTPDTLVATRKTLKAEHRAKASALVQLKRVKCETCGKSYSSRKSLKIHVRTHTGYKPYKCSLCPKSFSQSNVLKAHINAHTGQRDFFCYTCGRAFTQSAHMKTHQRIHSRRKDHTCTVCNRSFGSKGVLIRHCRQHTGEKPYRCARCPKTFTRAESLRSHENSHDGIRPYCCAYSHCTSTFTKKSSRKRHEQTCHRDARKRNGLPAEPSSHHTTTTTPGHAFGSLHPTYPSSQQQQQLFMTECFDEFDRVTMFSSDDFSEAPLSPEVFQQCLNDIFQQDATMDDLKFLANSPAGSMSSGGSSFNTGTSSDGASSDGASSDGTFSDGASSDGTSSDGSFESGFVSSPGYDDVNASGQFDGSLKLEPLSPSAYVPVQTYNEAITYVYYNNEPYMQQPSVGRGYGLPEPAYNAGTLLPNPPAFPAYPAAYGSEQTLSTDGNWLTDAMNFRGF
ncbi:putative Zinc finger and SCAN domain-containing protein 22 [Hypsibius exemplaris]|uniref:Zinc finger and SCAN domain-containing protein 22 n=1 Tax=Hypsibius exemplaris TaxID=2072580 RepID=A0A9X6NGZ9_HYPEX|nr:putative Zinc finger and SCAN domain-containing protein 22 [Hypsibius exemplaris]